MAACDVTGFMRDNADQHVRRVGPLDEAAVDEYGLTTGDERVELAVADDIDADARRIEPGDAPHRGRQCADAVVLDLEYRAE